MGSDQDRGWPGALVAEGGDDARERFAAWVAPYLPVMAALAARLAGPSDRDDVVQDALLRAWRRWETYDPERGDARAWLLAIVAGEARRWRVRRPEQVVMPVPEAAPAFVPDVDLERAVRALPRRMRLAVELHYFCDLPVSEVAAALGVADGTVKSALYDARRRLAAMLEER